MANLSEIATLILEWSHDPIKFIQQVFGVEPTRQQKEVLRDIVDMVWAKIKVYVFNSTGSLVDGIPITDRERKLNQKFGASIMAGVGTGKGALASWVIIWFLTCFPCPKIAVTSPSAKQLGITLWAELAKWHQQCKLKDFFVWQSDKFYWKEEQGRQWFAVTRTANTKNAPEEQAETLAGLHEDFLMVVADEASGIPDPVFRPLESTLTRKCNFCLLFFNPTRSTGFAYDTQFKDRGSWIPHRWNAEESEIVTKDSIERLATKYGRDSNTFRIRVLGLPPVSGENHIIPWEWIEAAVNREVEPMENDELLQSFDVGGGGDDSILLSKRGPLVLPLHAGSYEDSNLLTDWAVRHILNAEPKAVLIDSIGIGWGIEGNLRKRLQSHPIDIVGVNVANSAFNPHRFYRLRDELWWKMREAFEKGIVSIPNDPLLMGDLNSPRYEEASGKVKVETKKDIKNRGLDSPNRADALMQTFMYDLELVRKLYNKKSVKKKSRSTGSWRTA